MRQSICFHSKSHSKLHCHYRTLYAVYNTRLNTTYSDYAQVLTEKKNIFEPNYIPILFQRYATTIRAISSRLKYYHIYYFIEDPGFIPPQLNVPTINSTMFYTIFQNCIKNSFLKNLQLSNRSTRRKKHSIISPYIEMLYVISAVFNGRLFITRAIGMRKRS